MNNLVKLITDEDGEACEPVWHVADEMGGAPAILCTGQVYGYGEGNAVTVAKQTKRGGITCAHCMNTVKAIKDIRL
jgi:hypothetical protein